MVLEMKVPHSPGISDLAALWPVFLSYVLSFIYISIYWNNHHHMMHAASKVNGSILWANMHLLFWLSLIPFATGWMGENHFAPLPVALYGVVLFMAGTAYFILAKFLVSHHGRESNIGHAIGRDCKGATSLILYAVAIALALFMEWLSLAIYVGVAMMWFIPDKRVEKVLGLSAHK